MMPLALIGAFALMGWGLFVLMVYRAGKIKTAIANTMKENLKLAKMLKQERILCDLQIRKMGEAHNVGADTINDILKRMRETGRNS